MIKHTAEASAKHQQEAQLFSLQAWRLSKKLTSWRPLEGLGDVDHVGDDRLDPIALALHLGHQARHLVPAKGRSVTNCGDQLLPVVARSGQEWPE